MKNFRLLVITIIAGLFCAYAYAASSTDFTANKHEKEFGVSCIECHEVKKPSKAPETDAKCISCHGGYDDLAKVTEKVDPNPHKTHFSDIPCMECHKVHSPSVNMCKSCHNLEMQVP